MQFISNILKGLITLIIIIQFNPICIVKCKVFGLSSVNFLFESFSPYAMIRFFEFNDKNWNISENCLKDMYQYLDGLKNGSLWAVKLYDATSYYSGGSFGGNKFRIHNPELCRNLQSEYLSSLQMHWNLRLNISAIPFPVQIVSAKYEIEMSTTKFYEFYTIQQLVCFPKSCNYEDLDQVMSAGIVQNNFIVRNMSYMGVRQVSGEYDFLDDGSFYILISLISTVIILFICAHFSEYWNCLDDDLVQSQQPNKTILKKEQIEHVTNCSEISSNELESAIEQLTKLSNNDENSLKKFNMHPLADSMTINNINTNNHVNLVKVKKVKTKNTATISLDIIAGNCDYAKTSKKRIFQDDGIFRNLLNSFSLKNNFDSLTRQSNDEKEIAAVRGLQVICSILMILAHTYTIMTYLSNNQLTKNGIILEFLKICRKQSTFLIDMFFFLSGANLTHLYFKTSCQGSWHVLEQLLHFLGMIAHKICSIILSYTIILICLEIASKHFYDNSVLELPSVDFYTCDLNKWRNVLYIDTFFPLQDRCMAWSWFISMEVQFFIVGSLILLLAQIHPKYSGAICTGLFISSIVASTALEMEPQIYNFIENNFEKDLMEFNLIHDKIWLRISPYLLGMCLGYILYKTEGKFEMNIFIIVFGWIACFLIFIGFIFGFQLILMRINPWIRAGVITLAHTIWCMILCWTILASISQYGGLLRKLLISKLFFVMGKLSNSVFLLGPLIIRSILLSGEIGIFLSGGQLIVMFLGFLIVIYSCAFMLHLFFEAPLLGVLRVIYGRQNKKL